MSTDRPPLLPLFRPAVDKPVRLIVPCGECYKHAKAVILQAFFGPLDSRLNPQLFIVNRRVCPSKVNREAAGVAARFLGSEGVEGRPDPLLFLFFLNLLFHFALTIARFGQSRGRIRAKRQIITPNLLFNLFFHQSSRHN